MISDKLKKERKARMESRRSMYRTGVDPIVKTYMIGSKKILSIVDQTVGYKDFTNFAGQITSDVTMLMRLADETAVRSALSKIKIVQSEQNNYGDMSVEEIALHIKPRDVQTLSEFDAWQKRLNDDEFTKIQTAIAERAIKSEPKED